jgi:uncharacterized membrane protein/nitrite reductase/ring-hydroxylating ferredoxin subunit
MKSKTNIKGHPAHPILVSFPITFFCTAFLLDAIFLFNGAEVYGKLATYLAFAGVLSGIVAAIPGIIDYYAIVPPNSSANKRAAQHGLLNSMTVIIFLVSPLLKIADINILYVLTLEGTGVILLTIAGWKGGTLIIRNQIGVDHRYAHAGKWSEEKITTASNKVELKDLDKLLVNQMKLFHINNKRIVVGRTETGFAAFDDRCSHRGGSLADGVMICGTVQCPWHGSQFDVRNGLLKAGPANENIKTYSIKEENRKIILEL